MSKKSMLIIAIFVLILLLIPLTVMQFTDEVHWTFIDFLAMGIILFAAGLTFNFIVKNIRNKKYRIILFAATIFIFFIIWAELAVGIFDSCFAGS